MNLRVKNGVVLNVVSSFVFINRRLSIANTNGAK